MPVEIEVDYPIPGDIIGSTFTVLVSYTLTSTFRKEVKAAASSVAPGTITVTILRSNGLAYGTGGAGSDTMVTNPQTSTVATEGSGQRTFTFQYNGLSCSGCKIDARLTPHTGTPATDLVEGINIDSSGGAL